MAANIENLTNSNFQPTIAAAPVPVLVDFWAPWCGPCRLMAPVLEELATELTGKLKVAKVDVDSNQEIAAQFGIQSIPTFYIFKGGQKVDEIVGRVSKADLKNRLAKVL